MNRPLDLALGCAPDSWKIGMNRFLLIACRFAAFGLSNLCFLTSAASAADMIPLPAKTPVEGLSQTEWSQRWWQWAFSFERSKSPIADLSGDRCGSRQVGNVWFLAGSYSTNRIERTCRVPAGKTLFFPLINYVYFHQGDDPPDCPSLVRKAAKLTDRPGALVLEIDGKRIDKLETYRLATPCFSVVPGEAVDAAANGYYVALAPLPKGEHTLNFGGILNNFTQAISYRLLVE